MDLPSIGTLLGSGGGTAAGMLLGIVVAKKFMNGRPACPAADTLAEVKVACRQLCQSVDRNSKVSEEATDALLTVVKAMVALKEGNKP